jgi:hypothetical protein
MRRPRAFGAACRPLNASVRLPIVVPRLEVSARMKSASEVPLCVRGRHVAVVRATRSGVQAIAAIVLSRPGAGCVNHHRRPGHQVPRSRSSSGRQPRGLACSCVSSGSSVRFGGVCRCRRGLAARFLHSSRLALFETNPSSPPALYGSVLAAYGRPIMRQPNYALERTANRRRNHRRHRAAAQRER